MSYLRDWSSTGQFTSRVAGLVASSSRLVMAKRWLSGEMTLVKGRERSASGDGLNYRQRAAICQVSATRVDCGS